MLKEELIEKIKTDERIGDELSIELMKDIESIDVTPEVVEDEYKTKYDELLKDYRNRFNEVVIDEKSEKVDDEEEEDKKEIIDIKEI